VQQEKTFHQKGEDHDKLQNSLKFSENSKGQIQPKELEKVWNFLCHIFSSKELISGEISGD
jgi:hypothetical protein